MRRIAQRRQENFNQNKRWSTALIDHCDQQEQKSMASQSTLLTNKLGISKDKADRACVATGFRSVQLAADWLLQRHDPEKLVRTEFIFLLCPDEILTEQIRKFTLEAFRSLTKESSTFKDRQHLRALKLSSFFYVPDQYVYALHQILDLVIDQTRHLFAQPLKLVLHQTNDYLMLIPDVNSRKIIENLLHLIKEKFEQIAPGVPIVPAKKLAHITLAHGLTSLFNLSADQRALLVQLAQICIDFDRTIRWNFRFYSREQSSMNEVVYRVISSLNERTLSNLVGLKVNDLFVVVDNVRLGEQENVYGRSHSTGEEGLFPLKNLRKTAETDTWTLQKSIPLTNDNGNDLSETNNVLPINETNLNEGRNLTKKSNSMFRLNLTNGRSDPLSSSSNPGLIRLFCLRHGERVDFAFGPSWPELAFDKSGNYHRINLNMPISLPRRRNPFRDFLGDSPITEIGGSQARLTGEALAANDCFAQYCYSSPALRCIQTAHFLLQGMGIEDRVKIRIEPGLFEFLGWYERGLPVFFNPSEFNLLDDEQMQIFNLDKSYRPIIPLEKLSRDEKYIDYYNRSFKVTQQITDKHKLTGANIFFIGHAATLEVCTRQLCSASPRSYSDFNGVIRKVPYLGLQLCERNPSDGQWSLKAPPIPPLQHANNLSYDWQIMK